MDKFSHDLLADTVDFKVEYMQYKGDVSMQSSHYHDHYEILYMMNGCRRLLLNNDQPFQINPGNIVLLKPYMIHKTVSAGTEIQARILINISKSLLQEITAYTSPDITACFDHPLIPLNFYQSRIVRQFLYNLLDTDKTPLFRREAIRVYLAALLLELSRQSAGERPAGVSGEPDAMAEKIQMIVKYIQKNYIYSLSLSAVAAEFHVSAGHLSRSFKKYMGTPFTKYVNNIRIIAAQRLLADGSLPVHAAADAAGFESLTHFERVFKSITGMTPNSYKRSVKNAGN